MAFTARYLIQTLENNHSLHSLPSTGLTKRDQYLCFRRFDDVSYSNQPSRAASPRSKPSTPEHRQVFSMDVDSPGQDKRNDNPQKTAPKEATRSLCQGCLDNINAGKVSRRYWDKIETNRCADPTCTRFRAEIMYNVSHGWGIVSLSPSPLAGDKEIGHCQVFGLTLRGQPMEERMEGSAGGVAGDLVVNVEVRNSLTRENLQWLEVEMNGSQDEERDETAVNAVVQQLVNWDDL